MRRSSFDFPQNLYPTLIAAWRRSRGGPGGATGSRLSPEETYAVARRVRELSRGFTRERPLAGERYLNDPDLLGAYLLHFWPISYAQTSLALAAVGRFRKGWVPDAALDIGAGPGAAALAMLEAGVRRVVATDRSASALALARTIAGARKFPLETRQWNLLTTAPTFKSEFDLIVVSHTMNELWPDHADRIRLRTELLLRICQFLSRDGLLLIIEPALIAVAQDAIRLRDSLVASGFGVEAPCIWQARCPALPKATCHGQFDWDPPRDMVRLAHAARIGRESLKMAWFALRRGAEATAEKQATTGKDSTEAPPIAAPDSAPDGGLYRVVSEPLLAKSGRVRYLICGPLGRFALSASKSCRAPGVRPFFALKRGDAIRFFDSEKRESGRGLTEASKVVAVEQV